MYVGGAVALDIGTGTGLLALLCARIGEGVREVAARNKFNRKILQGISTRPWGQNFSFVRSFVRFFNFYGHHRHGRGPAARERSPGPPPAAAAAAKISSKTFSANK